MVNNLLIHTLTLVSMCGEPFRSQALATLCGVAGHLVVGGATYLFGMQLVVEQLKPLILCGSLTQAELQPLRDTVSSSLHILLKTIPFAASGYSDQTFRHLSLSFYLGGTTAADQVLQYSFLPRLLDAPRAHWITVFPSAINALLQDWYTRIACPDDAFNLTEAIMKIVSHAATHSPSVLLATATAVISFAIQSNNKALARRCLQTVVPGYGDRRIAFEFLSVILIPLAIVMLNGEWIASSEPFATFWREPVKHFALELYKLQRGCRWMELAEEEFEGHLGCGNSDCNERLLYRAQLSQRFSAGELEDFSVWIWKRARIVRFFMVITDPHSRRLILGGDLERVQGFLYHDEECRLCDPPPPFPMDTAASDIMAALVNCDFGTQLSVQPPTTQDLATLASPCNLSFDVSSLSLPPVPPIANTSPALAPSPADISVRTHNSFAPGSSLYGVKRSASEPLVLPCQKKMCNGSEETDSAGIIDVEDNDISAKTESTDFLWPSEDASFAMSEFLVDRPATSIDSSSFHSPSISKQDAANSEEISIGTGQTPPRRKIEGRIAETWNWAAPSRLSFRGGLARLVAGMSSGA